MYTDSHCHLDFAIFDQDREQVLQRAIKAGVNRIIVPAVARSNWQAVKKLSLRAQIVPAYGLHPIFQAEHLPEHIDALRQWLMHNPVVAVGECGLDYCNVQNKTAQMETFEAQVALAQEFNRPLIIHARKALDAVLGVIKKYPGVRGILHSFSGSEQQARHAVELGFALGIGGPATYQRAQRLRRIIKQMPLTCLVLETDAPDQPLCGYQGQRNEPVQVIKVAECMAKIRHEAVELIAQISSQTINKLLKQE